MIGRGAPEILYGCARCGHLTWPSNPFFKCTCTKCVELKNRDPETMAAGGLGPKTIVNYAQVPKMVLASVVNSEGEQVDPRN